MPNKKTLVDIGIQLSLLSTIIPNKALVAVGPWWFYSMIFQFYLIFPVLLRIFEKYKGRGLLIISIAAYVLLIFVNPLLLNLKLNLLHTVFGHLPEFCLGIWIAGKKEFKINIWIYILVIFLFMLGNYYKVAWYFSHLTAMIILLPILQYFVKKIKNNDFINKIFLFIGLISVYLFAVHGFLRWEFVGLANYLNHPVAELITGIMFLIFSIGFAYLLFSTENQMRKWIGLSDNSKHRKYKIIMLIVLLAGLVLSVKACQGINYEKRKNKKETVKQKIVYDFEKKMKSSCTIIDTVAFSGNKSCLISAEKEYGPEYRFFIKDVDVYKVKEIKVSTVIYANIPDPTQVHVVFELRKSSNNSLLNWEN
ncbi:MAG: acyltransferase, partial [Bacteroidales bacterium]|nr:acyltransferase [Bacteroidales bacterium]